MANKPGVMNRERIMEEAIHSGEMEDTYVSAEFRENADEHVKGDISIDDLMRRTKRRWIQGCRKNSYGNPIVPFGVLHIISGVSRASASKEEQAGFSICQSMG